MGSSQAKESPQLLFAPLTKVLVGAETTQEDGAVFFAIEITQEGGETWTVRRRFKQFFELEQALRKNDPTIKVRLTPFPKKTLLTASAQAVDLRRCGLARWLHSLLMEAWTDVAVANLLHEFLATGDAQQHVALAAAEPAPVEATPVAEAEAPANPAFPDLHAPTPHAFPTLAAPAESAQ